MNLQTVIPIISKVVGRDLTSEVNLFYRARAAIGRCLNPQGQEFFMNNWPKAVDFMETPAGQEATAAFMNAWAQSLIPKTLTKAPEQLVQESKPTAGNPFPTEAQP